MPETTTPPQSEIEAMLASDGEIGRDALKFLETQKAVEAARNEALREVTATGGGEKPAEETPAAEEAAAETAGDDEVDDPQGELETREDPSEEAAQAAALQQGMLLSDYTRKTQELAEQRRALDAKEAQVSAKVAHLDGLIGELDAAVAAIRPDPRELARLEQTDPGRAALMKLNVRELQDKAAAARTQRAAIAAAQQAERVAHEVNVLMTAVPAFRDPETGAFNEALYAKVGAHARKLGLAPERWSEVVDAPLVRALYDSMTAEAKAVKAKGVKQALKEAPRVLKPGAGGSAVGGGRPSPQAAEQRAAAALAARPNSTEAIAARFLARDQAARASRRGPRVGGA